MKLWKEFKSAGGYGVAVTLGMAAGHALNRTVADLPGLGPDVIHNPVIMAAARTAIYTIAVGTVAAPAFLVAGIVAGGISNLTENHKEFLQKTGRYAVGMAAGSAAVAGLTFATIAGAGLTVEALEKHKEAAQHIQQAPANNISNMNSKSAPPAVLVRAPG